jgi:hypothetical protein
MMYQLPLLDLTGNFPVNFVYSCPWSTKTAYIRWVFVPKVAGVAVTSSISDVIRVFEVDLMFGTFDSYAPWWWMA